jgi:hypothetical protein
MPKGIKMVGHPMPYRDLKRPKLMEVANCESLGENEGILYGTPFKAYV